MENSVIRKTLNTFRNSKGKLQWVGSEVVMEVLRAWKGWAGCSAEFCREVVKEGSASYADACGEKVGEVRKSN